jgi:hypothetical protein
MSSNTVSLSEPAAFMLPGVSLATGRDGPRRRGVRNVMFWPAEFLRLVGVAYMFPVVILAIGVPLALALSGLIMAGEWLATLLP